MKRKIDLVYGGGSVGLMGLISRRVYEGGFHVLGLVSSYNLPSCPNFSLRVSDLDSL